MKSKFIFFFIFLFLCTPITFVSCDKESETREVQKSNTPYSQITKQDSVFRYALTGQLPLIQSIVHKKLMQKTNTTKLSESSDSQLNDTQLEVVLSELSAQSMCMLESYGIKFSDIDEYVDDINDPRIAVIGMLFVAVQEHNASIDTQKSGIQSNGRHVQQRVTYRQIMGCLGEATLGVNMADGIFAAASKISIESALAIAGRVACRTLGVFGAALAVAEFGDCMGWYSLW